MRGIHDDLGCWSSSGHGARASLFASGGQQVGGYLKRLDLHLAKFHYTLVVRHALIVLVSQSVLQSYAPARVLGALDGLLPAR